MTQRAQTAQNAYKIAATNRSNMKLVTAVEFDKMFVFGFAPTNAKTDVTPLIPLFAIDKRTGEESHFSPLSVPLDEYKRGKKLDLSMFE